MLGPQIFTAIFGDFLMIRQLEFTSRRSTVIENGVEDITTLLKIHLIAHLLTMTHLVMKIVEWKKV